MTQASNFMEEANAVKVIAFMEVAPLSDKFQQIVFNEEQAKELRDALFKILAPKEVHEQEWAGFTVITNDEVEVTLPDIRDTYGQDFIKEAKESED